MNSTPAASFRVMHHNCRTTKHLPLYLAAYAHYYKLDIIALNETRLAPSKNFNIPSYTSHRKDRDTRGGGCCLLVKQGIDADVIDLSDFPGAEAVAVSIPSPDGLEPLIVASIYNPPATPIHIKLLEHLAGLSRRVLIIGDLNSHHRMWLGRTDDANGKLIEEFIDDHDFIIGNDNTFTRYPDNATGMPSIIDLAVISRDLYRQTKSTWVDTTENFMSDHYPLHVEFAFKATTRKLEKHEVKIINWPKLLIQINSAFSILSKSTITNSELLEQRDAAVCSAMATAIHESTITKNIARNSPRALPPDILAKIEEKKLLLKVWQRSRHPADKAAVNKATAQVKRLIAEHTQASWRRACDELGALRASSTAYWKRLDKLSDEKPRLRRIHKLQLADGTTTSDPTAISERFATNLASVFQVFQGDDYNKDFYEETESEASSLFTSFNPGDEQPTDTAEIAALLKDIRGRGAPGEDGISNLVLKSVPRECLQPIVDLVNASIRLSHVPARWKKAVVVMIPKKGKPPIDVNSHRPISLLSTMSKLCERVILRRFDKWQRPLISKLQCGFTRQRSTNDQIMRLLQTGQAAINKNEKLGIVLIDFEKAFDKVWHAGLLHKLRTLNIPDYLGCWLKSYLAERTFAVRVGEAMSSTHPISAGVPQGSVLGPHLFNIYINDFVDAILEDSRHVRNEPPNCIESLGLALFADDATVWKASPSLKVIQERLQGALDAVSGWVSLWRQKVSVEKTVYTIIEHRGLISKIELSFTGKKLSYEAGPRFLGVHLDRTLSMKKQVDSIVAASKSHCNLLRRLSGKSWGVGTSLLIQTYQSLIRSRIDYCPFVALQTSKRQVKRLETIQSKAYRTATKWPRRETNVSMYSKYRVEPIIVRHRRLASNYLAKATRGSELIRDLVEHYKGAPGNFDGVWAKKSKTKTTMRKSIVGKIIEATKS